MMKTIALSCLLAFARAAPAAEAEADADAQYFGYAAHTAPLAHAVAAPVAPVAYHAAPAPTCVTEDVILVTQVCTPSAEEVCSTETVATQEIEYEKCALRSLTPSVTLPLLTPLPTTARGRLMPRLRLTPMLMPSTSPTATTPPTPLPLSLPPLLWLTPLLLCPLPTPLPTPSPRP